MAHLTKMRTFSQNKLWRDKAVGLMEQTGSKIHWERLDDAQYEKQLRLKMLEEAQEVFAAQSHNELIGELADVLEVMNALCAAGGISWNEVVSAQETKRRERGGFDDRMFVIKAEHPEGGFGEMYCLKDPEKYPEIDK